jgi:hypothetical protein
MNRQIHRAVFGGSSGRQNTKSTALPPVDSFAMIHGK